MPTHAEKRVLPFTPDQLFDVVADIEKYPEFLPWCIATRIRRREGKVIHADMVIGFKMFRERFTTKDVLDPPRRIDVSYHDGPFRYLNNHWIFEPHGEGHCELDFFIDFEFHSRLFQKMMGVIFNEAVKIMVTSFEKRAREIYGSS
ncbi:MAG: type II toxin-antitoxin system RatA family toxin [Rhodospirillales bacterium]|jgi:coenzyme Q-binding protein COQ10|nr:type II toxin-antitoxin system RatA family toxin [Rhodospirillales bacterium]|tara:strand:+ start:119 stop:556 length:438 start_codon:yes stop_codon:yes gene_type:complete